MKHKKKILVVTSVFEIPEIKLPEIKYPKTFWSLDKNKSKHKKN